MHKRLSQILLKRKKRKYSRKINPELYARSLGLQLWQLEALREWEFGIRDEIRHLQ
jgi:hypothetical protein